MRIPVTLLGRAEFNRTGIQKPLYYFKSKSTFREFFTKHRLSSLVRLGMVRLGYIKLVMFCKNRLVVEFRCKGIHVTLLPQRSGLRGAVLRSCNDQWRHLLAVK